MYLARLSVSRHSTLERVDCGGVVYVREDVCVCVVVDKKLQLYTLIVISAMHSGRFALIMPRYPPISNTVL